ncbi:MAG: TIGR04283 family arsenosugar biosynthesis glycosyltransferase [Deltaproteobacteria bacterium]|nr:TIGR04283 family arsenosugar biosynthesis glycosyltransferase [Deltaproteobacteria bacterium]
MPPILSIIIPVFREEAIINTALCNLEPVMSGMPVEIIVVDGDFGKSTIHAIQYDGIKKIVGPKGRGPQMNTGAREAKSDILLFLHVDTILPENAVNHIISACSNEDIVGGAFDLGIASKKPTFRWIEKIASIRSRITRIPYGDQAIFIKNRFFQTVGGFKSIPIMEDVELMRRIRKKGEKIILISEPVKTSPRRWEEEGVLYCTARNLVLACLFFSGVNPEALKKYYP